MISLGSVIDSSVFSQVEGYLRSGTSFDNFIAAINRGIEEIVEQAVEVAKSNTFRHMADQWKSYTDKDPVYGIINRITIYNDMDTGNTAQGGKYKKLWEIMRSGRPAHVSYSGWKPKTKKAFTMFLDSGRTSAIVRKGMHEIGKIEATNPKEKAEAFLIEALNTFFGDMINKAKSYSTTVRVIKFKKLERNWASANYIGNRQDPRSYLPKALLKKKKKR